MSIHPSLRGADKDKQQRSVLKRIERIKYLIGKGLWKEGDAVFGLPKIKVIKIKFKKEKAEKPEEGAAAAVEGAEGAATPEAGQKSAAPEEKTKSPKAPKDKGKKSS
ncbi:MAG: small basic protein [Candidatus Omnitrophota bacterium]